MSQQRSLLGAPHPAWMGRRTAIHNRVASTTGVRVGGRLARDRILARGGARANSNRAESGLPPLPEITPRSPRRRWATFAAMI